MDQETIVYLRVLKELKENCEKEGIELRDFLLYRLEDRLMDINNALETINDNLQAQAFALYSKMIVKDNGCIVDGTITLSFNLQLVLLATNIWFYNHLFALSNNRSCLIIPYTFDSLI